MLTQKWVGQNGSPVIFHLNTRLDIVVEIAHDMVQTLRINERCLPSRLLDIFVHPRWMSGA